MAATLRAAGVRPGTRVATVLSGADITHLIDTAEETGAVLVLDEAYMGFAGPDTTSPWPRSGRAAGSC